jgi:hypothetical protein
MDIVGRMDPTTQSTISTKSNILLNKSCGCK